MGVIQWIILTVVLPIVGVYLKRWIIRQYSIHGPLTKEMKITLSADDWNYLYRVGMISTKEHNDTVYMYEWKGLKGIDIKYYDEHLDLSE